MPELMGAPKREAELVLARESDKERRVAPNAQRDSLSRLVRLRWVAGKNKVARGIE
jgi:hypothetical protein